MRIPTVYAGELLLKGVPDAIKKSIIKDLTLPNPKFQQALAFGRNPAYATKGIPQTISYYREPAPEVIAVPRGYALPPNLKLDIKYNLTWHPTVYPDSLLTPLPWQQDVLDKWSLADTNAYNYTAVAPPGSGKSVCGLLVAKNMGQRTLVLVPTDSILKSWESDIQKVFGGELKYAVWKGKTSIKELTDEHLVIAMIPTLRNAEVTKWADSFGMVIVDEAHKVPAVTVFRLMENSHAAYRFGLTATPERTDRLENVIFWACGPVRSVAKKDAKHTVPLKVYKINMFFPVSKPGETDLKQNTLWLRQMRRKGRTAAIVNTARYIAEQSKDPGPSLLVASRVEMCESLVSSLIDSGVAEDKVFHFHSKLTSAERDTFFDRAKKGEVLYTVATTTMLAEGVNVPPWKHLFITQSFTASSLVRQVSGRVERGHTSKKAGYVWDFVDNCPICRKQFDRRSMVYQKAAKTIAKYKLGNKSNNWKPIKNIL